MIPPRERVAGAYYLAGIVAGVALFSVAPAAWELIDYLQAPQSVVVARWAYLLIVLTMLQLAYAVYLAQLPDWTTAWVVSLMALALAGAYGMLLGVAVMSREESRLIQTLELTDKLVDHKAAFWSIAMISATSLLAWYAGHVSGAWHRAELVLHQAGLSPQGK